MGARRAALLTRSDRVAQVAGHLPGVHRVANLHSAADIALLHQDVQVLDEVVVAEGGLTGVANPCDRRRSLVTNI